jgi:xylono-1,5-lactonase
MSLAKCIWPARALLGEGPVFDSRSAALLFVDIHGRKLFRLNLDTGTREQWDLPDKICWVLPRARRPGYIAGMRDAIVELDLEPFAIRPLTAPGTLEPGHRFNDAKVDAWGRIWAGSMHEAETQSSGALFRLDADHSLQCMDDGYRVANGPTFSPVGTTLYHTDSAQRTVWRFALAASGAITDKQVFVRFEDSWGYPDGMTTDAEGGVWIAHWDGGRVSRFTAAGSLDRSIALPVSRVTSCVFGGSNSTRLFVTTAAQDRMHEPLAGALFEIDAQVRGLTPCAFDG